MRFFHASIATTRRPEIRRDLCRPDRSNVASRPEPNWQPDAGRFSLDGAKVRPLPRARLSPPSACGQMAVGRSPSRANHRTPARARRARRLRLHPCVGYSPLARTLGCSDHTRRDRDRLRAGDAAAHLLGAGDSASAPYRRAPLAAIYGGGNGTAAVRLPSAAASVRQGAT
jgi:hypothetical protein